MTKRLLNKGHKEFKLKKNDKYCFRHAFAYFFCARNILFSHFMSKVFRRIHFGFKSIIPFLLIFKVWTEFAIKLRIFWQRNQKHYHDLLLVKKNLLRSHCKIRVAKRVWSAKAKEHHYFQVNQFIHVHYFVSVWPRYVSTILHLSTWFIGSLVWNIVWQPQCEFGLCDG